MLASGSSLTESNTWLVRHLFCVWEELFGRHQIELRRLDLLQFLVIFPSSTKDFYMTDFQIKVAATMVWWWHVENNDWSTDQHCSSHSLTWAFLVPLRSRSAVAAASTQIPEYQTDSIVPLKGPSEQIQSWTNKWQHIQAPFSPFFIMFSVCRKNYRTHSLRLKIPDPWIQSIPGISCWIEPIKMIGDPFWMPAGWIGWIAKASK